MSHVDGQHSGTGTRGTPQIVVVCGLPGTGKTTVAREIARRIDADRFRTDVVRKELRSSPTYTTSETGLVYAELFERARRSLASGHNVVLDGTFRDRSHRKRTTLLAAQSTATRTLVAVDCDDAILRERIEQRTDDESDADYEVHRTIKATFDPLPDGAVHIDNSGPLAATHRQVRRHFPSMTPSIEDSGEASGH